MSEDRMTTDGAAYFPETLTAPSEIASPEYSTKSSDLAEHGKLFSATSTACYGDEELIEEVVRGSKEALGLLFRRYRRPVSNIAQRILKDSSEAEDLCQDVFVFVFEKAELYDASKGGAASWIIQIAYHRALNRRKYLTHRQHYDAQELKEDRIGNDRPTMHSDEIDARTLLKRLRAELSPEQQQTLELHFFEGYSLREIAEKPASPLEMCGTIIIEVWSGFVRMSFPKRDSRVRELVRKSFRARQSR
jgi:RNA polymerase sigma-70 factor (ECF subfamily)